MPATSGRAGREMIAATFFTEDDDELAMSDERKKDCTEFEAKTLTTKPAGERRH